MNYKVLMADDDEIVLLLGQTALEESGFELRIAKEGTEVVSLFQSYQPDIVILDVNLPGKDGITICSEIRELKSGKLVPILMITGLDDLNAINRCLEAGATDFESKPVNWLILGQKLRFLIHSSALYRKHAKELLIDENENEFSKGFFDHVADKTSIDARMIETIRMLEQESGRAVLQDLIDNFQKEIPIFLQRIHEAVQKKDAVLLESYVFYVRTKCGNIGATKMKRVCKAFEWLLQNRSFELLDELVEELQVEYEAALRQLQHLR